MPCIHYLLYFQNDITGVKALIDSGSEVNAMTPAYALKLYLKVYPINVGAQKIDVSTLETFEMVTASFKVEDNLRRAWFF